MEAAISNGVLVAGVIAIRPREYLATVDGRPLKLTARELDLLTALVERAGRIVSREELYRVVWHEDYRKSDRSVDVYIAKLRQKLEAARPDTRFIHTHFGFGYRLQPEGPDPEERGGSGDPASTGRTLPEERRGIGDPASTGRTLSHGFHIPETSP